MVGVLRGCGGAVRDGAPPPVDPADAVRALEVLEAARRSAAAGAVVTLVSRSPLIRLSVVGTVPVAP